MARATPFLGHEGPGAQLLVVDGVGDDYQRLRRALSGCWVRASSVKKRLNRFYVLHCIAIPLGCGVVIGDSLLASP